MGQNRDREEYVVSATANFVNLARGRQSRVSRYRVCMYTYSYSSFQALRKSSQFFFHEGNRSRESEVFWSQDQDNSREVIPEGEACIQKVEKHQSIFEGGM